MEVLYERDPHVGNGYQAYKGKMQWAGGYHEFTGLHFELLLRTIHDKTPPEDQEFLFVRTDREGLPRYQLDDTLSLLLKTDVEEAIRRMSVPDIRVKVGRGPKSTSLFTTCGDTLAECFGDTLYAAYRQRGTEFLVECPGCGHWCVSPLLSTDVHVSCTCGIKDLVCRPLDTLWVGFKYEDIIATGLNRFFFPRRWNGSQPWVSREKLLALHNSFVASKDEYHEK